MIDYAKLEQHVREQLTQRAAAAIQSPERQKAAMQQVNEFRQEPDQRSDQYGTAGMTDEENERIHNNVRRRKDPGSNIDDVEARGDSTRVTHDAEDDPEYTDQYDHKRPADQGGS